MGLFGQIWKIGNTAADAKKKRKITFRYRILLIIQTSLVIQMVDFTKKVYIVMLISQEELQRYSLIQINRYDALLPKRKSVSFVLVLCVRGALLMIKILGFLLEI